MVLWGVKCTLQQLILVVVRMSDDIDILFMVFVVTGPDVKGKILQVGKGLPAPREWVILAPQAGVESTPCRSPMPCKRWPQNVWVTIKLKHQKNTH